MCKVCDEESGRLDEYEDSTMFENIMYLIFMSPLLVWAFLCDVVFSASARRERRKITKLNRQQKRIYKQWSGR